MGHRRWEIADSPIGELLIETDGRGISRVAWDFGDPEEWVRARARSLGVEPPVRGGTDLIDTARGQLEAWFRGALEEFDLPLSPDPRTQGNFAARVLSATSAVPRGETRTYGEVALAAGNPRAARAAGNALGANPIPIIIPCHRIVAADGLGGFGGGSRRKRILLAVEAG